jgi:uncharacterized YccA/Bax inhibitor family protein
MTNPAFTRSEVFNGKRAAVAPVNPYSQPGVYGQTGPYGQANGYATSSAQLNSMYAAPSAGPISTGRMTYDDVLIKSVSMFGVLLVGATVGWLLTPSFLALPWIGFSVGFILCIINCVKRVPSPALVTAYALAEGLALGGISMIFEYLWNGIVLQAVLATLAVFGITLALFASGKVRASSKASRIVLIALIAYLLYSIVNVTLIWTGVTHTMFGMSDSVTILGIPLGLIIGPLVVLLGAYCLVESFDFIKRGVENGAPGRYAWTAAFGLLVDLIFLYIQILRILAILRN